MAVASIVACVLIGLLAGGVGGVLVYRQVEYGTPPSWQTEIISRLTMTVISSLTLSNQQFEYQGNSKWTDLHGTGGTSDVGMWSLMVDANASSLRLEHTRVLTLSIADQSPSYYVIASIELPNSGFFFQYASTPISIQATIAMQLTIDHNYALVSHMAM
jgi:hypothetical protein